MIRISEIKHATKTNHNPKRYMNVLFQVDVCISSVCQKCHTYCKCVQCGAVSDTRRRTLRKKIESANGGIVFEKPTNPSILNSPKSSQIASKNSQLWYVQNGFVIIMYQRGERPPPKTETASDTSYLPSSSTHSQKQIQTLRTSTALYLLLVEVGTRHPF